MSGVSAVLAVSTVSGVWSTVFTSTVLTVSTVLIDIPSKGATRKAIASINRQITLSLITHEIVTSIQIFHTAGLPGFYRESQRQS